MTSRRPAPRLVGALALLAPLGITLALASVPPAVAAAAVSGADGSTYSSAATITLSGAVPRCDSSSSCSSVTLTVSAPSGYSDSSQSATVQEIPNSPGKVTVRINVTAATPNGGWMAALSGDASGSGTFTTDYGTATPRSFRARVTNGDAHDVAFSWSRNAEPDLMQYVLTEGGATRITATDDACSADTCSASLAYDQPYSGTHQYQLVAVRPSGSGTGTHTSAAATATASLSRASQAGPGPTPTAGPPAGNGGSSNGGASNAGPASGAATGASSPSTSSSAPSAAAPSSPLAQPFRTVILSFNAFSPSFGLPKIPRSSSSDEASLGSEGPLPMGTYQPTLPYGSQPAASGSALSRQRGSTWNGLELDPLAKSLAVALVLLLAFGHLRRFLGAGIDAEL